MKKNRLKTHANIKINVENNWSKLSIILLKLKVF